MSQLFLTLQRLKVEHEKLPSRNLYNKGDYTMIKTLLQQVNWDDIIDICTKVEET